MIKGLKTLRQFAQELQTGETTSRQTTDTMLERIADPAGEGGATFIQPHTERARAEADASDARRAQGLLRSPIDGIPISIKDLFNEVGQTTCAGAKLRESAEPEAEDAPVVARLRAAGAIIIGRTNMTEFAFSGVGLNPHYGTPANPFDRETRRIPGGSSSGAAISVTDGMAAAAIGTDTGGSVRIPAALCGLTGFKPSQYRVPLNGVFPLSSSLDSVGPLAPTVACCSILDQILSGQTPAPMDPMEVAAIPVAGLRLAVPQSLVLDGLDKTVAYVFEKTLTRLSDQGAWIVDIELEELLEISEFNANGGIICAEAYALHRQRLKDSGSLFDPNVGRRIQRGAEPTAADFIDLLNWRADLCDRVDNATAPYDALIMPTVPIIAPPIADLADNDEYGRVNMAMLRNTSVGNLLDRCAISLPCHGEDDPPVGLMLMGEADEDFKLLAVAAGIEAALGRG